LQKSVEDIFLILNKNHKLYIIDSGTRRLHSYLSGTLPPYDKSTDPHFEGVELFISEKIR